MLEAYAVKIQSPIELENYGKQLKPEIEDPIVLAFFFDTINDLLIKFQRKNTLGEGNKKNKRPKKSSSSGKKKAKANMGGARRIYRRQNPQAVVNSCGIKHDLTPKMSDEERRQRNGDKRVQEGFSSTGVPLPSQIEMSEYHRKMQEQRHSYDRYIKENPEKRKKGKMFISVSMGGHNKRY